jgi:hypothetical protein
MSHDGSISMPALNKFYDELGLAKSRELYEKYNTLSSIYNISKVGTRSRQIGGMVPEGIAKDFAREFMPARFKIKSGIIFDQGTTKLSPQIDAIIYEGVPLLDYTDVTIVEKENVKGIFEVKGWVAENDIFGQKTKRGRNPKTGLSQQYSALKPFLPPKSPYTLFVFSLSSASPTNTVINRLKQISDMYAIIGREVPRTERKVLQENTMYNLDNSVSKLIEWLRNLK